MTDKTLCKRCGKNPRRVYGFSSSRLCQPCASAAFDKRVEAARRSGRERGARLRAERAVAS